MKVLFATLAVSATFDEFVQGFREQHTLWDERTVRPAISHFEHREVVMCGTHMESGLLLQFFPFFFCQVLLPPFCVRRETRRIFCGVEHMLKVPGADGSDQLVEDCGEATFWIPGVQSWRPRPPRTRLCQIQRAPRT